MANIRNVDYEDMPRHAEVIREKGVEINESVTQAYEKIAELHEAWHGQRYVQLVNEFNGLVGNLNDLLELVVGEIPFALETIANNYAQADRGENVTSAQNSEPNKINEIAVPNDVGMRFMTSDVERTRAEVSRCFEDARSRMGDIETEYGKINWDSDASSEFQSRFEKLKGQIISAFENIGSDFKSLMQQTAEDIESAESANTVS